MRVGVVIMGGIKKGKQEVEWQLSASGKEGKKVA